MKEEERKKLGRIIRAKRDSMDLSLEDVVTELKKRGIETSKQNISRYELGKYERPDEDLLAHIFKILKIEKSEITNNEANSVSIEWCLETIKHLKDKIRLQELLIEEYRSRK